MMQSFVPSLLPAFVFHSTLKFHKYVVACFPLYVVSGDLAILMEVFICNHVFPPPRRGAGLKYDSNSVMCERPHNPSGICLRQNELEAEKASVRCKVASMRNVAKSNKRAMFVDTSYS